MATAKRGPFSAPIQGPFSTLFDRWVIDTYGNTPHRGLGGETPRDAWHRLAKTFGIAPPPGKNTPWHVFGLEVNRMTRSHGVRFLNLDFQAEKLQARRRAVSDQLVRVRVDPFDLGRVSVFIDAKQGWCTCRCRIAGFDDVTVGDWLAAAADLSRRHARHAKLSEPIVIEAVRAVRALARTGIETFGLGETRPTPDSMDRAERDLAIGFRMPDPEHGRPETVSNGGAGLLESAVEVDGTGLRSPARPERDTPTSDGADESDNDEPYWNIEDDA